MTRPPARTEVVTAFLIHEGKVLLVRRSGRVGSYRGRWAGISGYLEAEEPLAQAYTELREETGLTRRDLRLLAQGEPLEVDDPQGRWRVHPFAFAVGDPEKIRLNWENVEQRWVEPRALEGLDTVPGLAEALARVWR